MTKFENHNTIVEVTWAPATEDSVTFNKHSLAELDEVLDQLQISPSWLARLEKIIEDSK